MFQFHKVQFKVNPCLLHHYFDKFQFHKVQFKEFEVLKTLLRISFQFHKVQFKECGGYGEQLYERGFNSIRYNLKRAARQPLIAVRSFNSIRYNLKHGTCNSDYNFQ